MLPALVTHYDISNIYTRYIVKNSSKTFCTLDPFPTKLIVELLPELGPAITKIINLALSFGQFPPQLKSALVKPLIKKSSLDCELLNNYRPVSNLLFLSKLIEKVIATRLFTHMKDNNLLEKNAVCIQAWPQLRNSSIENSKRPPSSH